MVQRELVLQFHWAKIALIDPVLKFYQLGDKGIVPVYSNFRDEHSGRLSTRHMVNAINLTNSRFSEWSPDMSALHGTRLRGYWHGFRAGHRCGNMCAGSVNRSRVPPITDFLQSCHYDNAAHDLAGIGKVFIRNSVSAPKVNLA